MAAMFVEEAKLAIPGACFEAVASEGTGVLQTLTTLSKLVLTELRKVVDTAAKATPAKGAPAVTAEPDTAPSLAPRAAKVQPEATAKGFTIESAGPVDGGGSELTIPVRLVDEETGRRVEIAVRIAIDSL